MANLDFSMITEKLKYPPIHKGQLQSIHSEIITYCTKNYDGTVLTRVPTINALNAISQLVLSGDTIPKYNSIEQLINILQVLEPHIDSDVLGPLYLDSTKINWDIPIVIGPEVNVNNTVSVAATPTEEDLKRWAQEDKVAQDQLAPEATDLISPALPEVLEASEVTATASYTPSFTPDEPTPKSDILLAPPKYPQLDTSKIFAEDRTGPNHLVVYYSLPEIPTCQREISVTTDINKMRDSDLLNLFPNRMIRVRHKDIYTVQAEGLEQHPELSYILPIAGYTKEQLIDNIVKYPTFIKLRRVIDGELVNFADNIEIDGELHKTLEVWDTLPDTENIPKTAGFVIEYVVRRYLLERDIKHIEHKYPMLGTLDPFLTLFMPADDYKRYGYKDSLALAKANVNSRVSYKTTRNPILRRIESVRMSIQS